MNSFNTLGHGTHYEQSNKVYPGMGNGARNGMPGSSGNQQQYNGNAQNFHQSMGGPNSGAPGGFRRMNNGGVPMSNGPNSNLAYSRPNGMAGQNRFGQGLAGGPPVNSFNSGIPQGSREGGYSRPQTNLNRSRYFNVDQIEQRGGGSDFLVPNEVRISLKGNFKGQVGHILFILRSGYMNCKVVGRGSAGERITEIVKYLQKAYPEFTYSLSSTKSLNKLGNVVDEMHLMISHQQQQAQVPVSTMRNPGYQGAFKRPPNQNYGDPDNGHAEMRPNLITEDVRSSQRRAQSARRPRRGSQSPTEIRDNTGFVERPLHKQHTFGEERQQPFVSQSGVQNDAPHFKTPRHVYPREPQFQEPEQPIMSVGYSYRNARSTIRGGGPGGKVYPSERQLQQVGIRDSNFQSRNAYRGGGGEAPRSFRDRVKSVSRGNTANVSETRKITYQPKDIKVLPNGKVTVTDPQPIKLYANKENQAFHGVDDEEEEIQEIVVPATTTAEEAQNEEASLAAQAERIAESTLVA